MLVRDVKGIDGSKKVLAFYDDEGEHSRLVLKCIEWMKDTERAVVYLSRLEGIEYVNEKDRLKAHGYKVVEASVPDRISDRWLTNLMVEKVKAYEPDTIVLPATLLGIDVINNMSIVRALNMVNCNVVVVRHFTIHVMHQAKVMLKRILQR
jgi:electron transfer flavoprotein alpha subunit